MENEDKDDRKDFVPYGVSIIDKVSKEYRKLKLMEDALIIYRLVYGKKDESCDR
jgi:hypothetical protein